jgi:alkanesulfonate monooxygenase SsuD/methylene tetrahydromethanopterin reductase-like flavin-dependent oxidoreductase (luciferase family)
MRETTARDRHEERRGAMTGLTTRPRIGVLSFARPPVETLLERWRRFEELGLDSAWVDDDLMAWPGYSEFEGWTLLAGLAAATSRMRTGMLVASMAFRHPALLAAQVLTVDALSKGRVSVGVGSSADAPEFNAVTGLPAWSPVERTARFEEYVAVLGRLLRGEAVEHDGPAWPTSAKAVPQPVQRPRPPLIVAAQGPRGIALAAREADVWACTAGQPSTGEQRPIGEVFARAAALVARVDEACAAHDRDRASLARSAFVTGMEMWASLGEFDEIVGGFAGAGFGEVITYWPPMGHAAGGEPPVTPEQEAMFERICVERLTTSTSSPHP